MKKFWSKMRKTETSVGFFNIIMLIMLIPTILLGIWMAKTFCKEYLEKIKTWFKARKGFKEKYYDWKNRKYNKLDMEEY